MDTCANDSHSASVDELALNSTPPSINDTMSATIALGTQGLHVSKLGYGCMGLTTAYGSKLPDDEIVSLLEKVYAQGVTLVFSNCSLR